MLPMVGVEWPAVSNTQDWGRTQGCRGPFTPSTTGEKENQDQALRGRFVFISNYISAP